MDETIDFKLMPVYDEKAIFNTFGFYIEGIEEVLEYGTGETLLSNVYEELMAKRLLLWVGFLNNKYCGFVTTAFTNTPLGEKVLWIKHLYIKKGLTKDIFFEGMKDLFAFAKNTGCKTIKFYTIRNKAFFRKLSSRGWKDGYQEFIFNL